jgi:hypothetical protein
MPLRTSYTPSGTASASPCADEPRCSPRTNPATAPELSWRSSAIPLDSGLCSSHFAPEPREPSDSGRSSGSGVCHRSRSSLPGDREQHCPVGSCVEVAVSGGFKPAFTPCHTVIGFLPIKGQGPKRPSRIWLSTDSRFHWDGEYRTIVLDVPRTSYTNRVG